jgi:prophage regulatory protein
VVHMSTSFLRLPRVVERTGLSRSSIYAKAKTGAFPKPVKLGARTSAWVASEVQEWMECRVLISRSAAPGPA